MSGILPARAAAYHPIVAADRSPDAAARSAWHNFQGAALTVMRAAARAKHPTRPLVDDLMRRWYGQDRFDWLDVGVVGMVDYERLRPKMRFRFTGADLSESVAEDSRRYITEEGDRVVVWDIQETPSRDLLERFDLITLRHILNHCEHYEPPLAHAATTLRAGGRIVVVLHLALVEGPDEHRRHTEWDVPGQVIGNRYNRAKFLSTFTRYFEPLLFVRVDDGKKPNDLIVARKRAAADAGDARVPSMHVLWMPPRRRYAPLRWLARLRFAWLSRAV